MKNRFIALLILALSACFQTARSQTVEELKAQIKAFHKCFYEYSLPQPTHNEVTLSNGKTVRSLFRCDYKNSAFVSVDETLKDVELWRNSPYLWRMKHKKDNFMLMDDQDLSDWERNGIEKISDSYFNGSKSSFHIAAHGLLDSDGAASGKILIGGQYLDAAETAELIIKSMHPGFDGIIEAEEQDFSIVVHSCYSASGKTNFAAELSKEIGKYIQNTKVVGAPEVVYCKMDDDGKYDECVTSPDELTYRDPIKQNWKIYQDGKESGTGRKDWRDTLASFQSK